MCKRSVTDDLLSYGNMGFSGTPNRSSTAAPQISEIFGPSCNFFKYTLSNGPTDPISGPMITRAGSNDVVWPKKIPLEGGIFTILRLGDFFQPNKLPRITFKRQEIYENSKTFNGLSE